MNNLEKVMNKDYAVRCENKEEFELLKAYMQSKDIKFEISYPHGLNENKPTIIQIGDNVASYTLPSLSMIPEDKIIMCKNLIENNLSKRHEQITQLINRLKENKVLEQKFIDLFTYDPRWDDEETVSDEQFKSETGAIFDSLIAKQTVSNDDKKAIKELLQEKGMIDRLDHYLEQYETKGFKIVRNFIESKYTAKLELENCSNEEVTNELQEDRSEMNEVEYAPVEGRKEYVQECKDTAVNSRVIGKKFIDKFSIEDRCFTTEIEDEDFKEKVQAELNRLIGEEEQYKNDCNKIKSTCQQHNCDNYRKYVERYRTGTNIDDVLHIIKDDYPIIEKTELDQELEETTIEKCKRINDIQAAAGIDTETIEATLTIPLCIDQKEELKSNCLVDGLRKEIIKQADILGIDLMKIKSGIIIEDNESNEIEEVIGSFASTSKKVVGGWSMVDGYLYKCHYDEFDEKHGNWNNKQSVMIRLTAVNEMLSELGGQK